MWQRIKENRYLPFILLTILTLLLLFLPLGLFIPSGKGGLFGSGESWFFGSGGDWFSQHVAIAQSLRETMLSNQKILPQWIGLGGGSNIYDFAYYGLLRPDVLVACLAPDVEMKYFVAGYAALGVLLSGWFCYLWLQKCGKTRWISFAGAVLLVSAACFYHAHHQIMFVNYMPFLVLALIGVEHMIQKGKINLLAASVCLIILHSFYYAPASICVVGVYALHRILNECAVRQKQKEKPGIDPVWEQVLKIVIAIGLAVGMAMILLLPVGLDILSTAKDGGSAAEKGLELLDIGMEGLLYNPYGCGMTLITLYTLLLSLRKKENRFLSVVLLTAMLVPVASLVLNGFLYARAKILIPFVPLLALVCVDTLQEMWEKRRKAEWFPLLLCLIPVLVSEWRVLILAEGAVLAFWIGWQRRNADKRREGFWLILLVPVCFSIGVNLGDSYLRDFYQGFGMTLRESYISAEDDRQRHVPAEEIEKVVSESEYRFEILADSFVNCNVLPTGEIERTSMYSSISDGAYSAFYYDTMGNAISFNNRVALVAGKNPFFNYFMGVRYLLTGANSIPQGYEMKETYGDYVLAENEEVLPICYGSSTLLSREAFDKLEFPDTLEALCTRTIVETENEINVGTQDEIKNGSQNEVRNEMQNGTQSIVQNEFEGHFVEQDAETFFETGNSQIETLLSAAKETETMKLKLSKPLHNQIVVIRFHVNRKNGEEVVISVNGIKNKLSAASAPYPNKNEEFTYIFDGGETLEELQIKKSAGEYEIEQVEIYTLDNSYLKLEHVAAVREGDSTTGAENETVIQDTTAAEQTDGTALVYQGSITMEENGYFVTSYPYRDGYQIFVDGTETPPQVVNTTFLGCPVPAGVHTIEIRFTAPGYKAGRLISIGALAMWGAILLWKTFSDFGKNSKGFKQKQIRTSAGRIEDSGIAGEKGGEIS